jgi:hypothetical protein
MSPELGKMAFRLAFFVTFVSAALLPFLQTGTAEFVVDVLSLGVGLVFIAAIAILVRRSTRG